MDKRYEREKGTVLIAAMVILAFLVVVTAAALQEGVTKSQAVDAVSVSRQCLLCAESGLDTAIVELNRRTLSSQPLDAANDGVVGTDSWDPDVNDANGNGEPDFGEVNVVPVSLSGGEYFTHVVRFGTDGVDNDNDGEADGSSEQAFVRVVTKARIPGQEEMKELTAVVRSMAAPDHPIFSGDYAIYAGNREQREEDYGEFTFTTGGEYRDYYRCRYCGAEQSTPFTCIHRTWRGNVDGVQHYTVDEADVIEGKTHVNGDIGITEDSAVIDLDGDGTFNDELSATGEITGVGSGTSDAGEILPPDIAAMDYEHTAEFTVSTADPPTVTKSGCYGNATTYPESDPRHIFTDQDYRSDLGYLQTNHDNRNWFLADLHEGTSNNDGDISISPEGNDSVYFVDGNLWLEAGCFHYRYFDPPADGARMTIVVRGNVYVCDDFWLGNEGTPPSGFAQPPDISNYENNGLAIIAISDGESYTDVNGNNAYDPGEPFVNDDGVPGYQGCQEGSGNVYYGDPNTGPVGVSQAFFYAENNFDDYSLDQNGEALEMGIQGLMSAGNQIRMNRDFGEKHARMTVLYDPRLSDGTISLPGLPVAASAESDDPVGPWGIVSWRERAGTGPWM